MKPLILAATEFEIKPTIPLLDQKEIPYLITGVGMTATAFTLGAYLEKNPQTNCVINIGIAGCLDKQIPLGTLFNIQTDTFSELGAQDDKNFIAIDELGFGQSQYQSIPPKIRPLGLPTAHSITVNRVHGRESSIAKIRQRLPHITLESMEGAAVFYGCQQRQIPCIQVRAVSNYVQKRDKSSWNIPLALDKLNSWLQQHIQQNY